MLARSRLLTDAMKIPAMAKLGNVRIHAGLLTADPEAAPSRLNPSITKVTPHANSLCAVPSSSA